jgi:hypothetical protein
MTVYDGANAMPADNRQNPYYKQGTAQKFRPNGQIVKKTDKEVIYACLVIFKGLSRQAGL